MPIPDTSLTGRTRLKVSRFNRLLLEVEEKTYASPLTGQPLTRWRYADRLDLAMLRFKQESLGLTLGESIMITGESL